MQLSQRRVHRLLVHSGVLTLAASMMLTAPAGTSAADATRSTVPAPVVDCASVLSGSEDRQDDFVGAAATAGVPDALLLATSYAKTRWDDHGGSPSTDGGYGPLHLTDVAADELPPEGDGRGLGVDRLPRTSLRTAELSAELTGLPVETVRSDPAANVCAGAALLRHLQEQVGGPVGQGTDLEQWQDAVAAFSGSGDPATAGRFVQQVWRVLRDGATRTTGDGETVSLPAQAGIEVPAPVRPGDLTSSRAECPRSLGCWWVPAPYEWYGAPDPGAYGNHDLADRPRDLSIDYIVIHDTEATWETTLDLVTDPEYVSWQYSLRSLDGQIAQHVPLDDVAWHAGNWYVNMHSIGLEHEGFAAEGATWYSESMYQSSAALVRWLTARYDIPRDRAHIIGHDQIPGTTPETVAGMHWDPGPFWDWEYYLDLVRGRGGPGTKVEAGRASRRHRSQMVEAAPRFVDNPQPVTGCDSTAAGAPCPTQGTNFVYLHQAPSLDAPLVPDEGLAGDADPSTTEVWDIGARVAAGQRLVVAGRQDDWLGVWYLGRLGWLHSPAERPVVRPVRSGLVVTARPGLAAVPVYGRAYPEETAYPPEIPVQPVTPLQYSLTAGQRYAVADADPPTDFYYAKSFDDSVPGNRTVVRGRDDYLQVWFGHRFAYVRAADVVVRRR